MTAGQRLYVEVQFAPNERGWREYDLLEPYEEDLGPFEELDSRSLGTDADLRRTLTLEKVRGRLTNVFYSMESSNTDFHTHQFKPVLKFLESPVGRLLIADEVGLGKTIEALFIWKELQAREMARRLLIVCPAVLQEKWQDDLSQKFSLHADILRVGDLYDRLNGYLTRGTPSEFAAAGPTERAGRRGAAFAVCRRRRGDGGGDDCVRSC
jgi:SNF2 family DNA or RNA helicase